MQLTALQRDAIVELLNIGMGRAASSLSEMVAEEVLLSVPEVFLVSRDEAIARLGLSESTRVSTVCEGFSGPFAGDALLMFPQADSLDLVHALLREEMPLEMLSEMEQEALTEVGNIVLNACLGSLGNVFTRELSYQLPVFLHGECADMLDAEAGRQRSLVLSMRTDFGLQRAKVDGHLVLIMDLASIHAFLEQIDRYIREVSGPGSLDRW